MNSQTYLPSTTKKTAAKNILDSRNVITAAILFQTCFPSSRNDVIFVACSQVLKRIHIWKVKRLYHVKEHYHIKLVFIRSTCATAGEKVYPAGVIAG